MPLGVARAVIMSRPSGPGGGGGGATPVWASQGAKFESGTTGVASVSYPATVNAGDLILMTCLMRADTSTSLTLHADATAAGFVTLASALSGARRYIVAWKSAAGTEDGTSINGFTTAGTSNVAVIAKMDRFTAADGFAATPYESLASIGMTLAAGASGPTITPTGTNRRGVCLVLVQGNISISSAFTGASPDTWTTAAQQVYSTLPGVLIQTQQIDLSAGSAVSGGSNTFDTSRQHATVSFALVPDTGATPFSIDRQIAASADDAEERTSNNTVVLTSSDIELGYDNTDATILKTFLRFTNITMAAGATVNTAYIQFKAEEVDSSSLTVRIKGVAQANPTSASGTASYITNLTKTTAFVDWVIPSWPTVGAAGADQRTPNLKTIIDEIKAIGGWASGNAMAFVIEWQAGSVTGKRSTYSYDNTPANAAILHIEGTV